MTSGNSLLTCPASVSSVESEESGSKVPSLRDAVMSQVEEEDPKHWTENDLKEAIRRINAGEINFKEAENVYGISPRTIHRQRAIENMRAQLNPEKAKKLKSGNNPPTKKDLTILRKAVDLSCTSLTDVCALLSTATEEVKQLLSHECDLIYECKVCKNLFRSLANFISHKRIYCCDLYSVIHTRTDENDDDTETVEERLKEKENIKEFAAKPFRVTCRKDLTTVLKRLTTMSDLLPSEPILHLQTIENTPCAFQQVLYASDKEVDMPFESTDTESKENTEMPVVQVEKIVEKPKPPPVEKPPVKSTTTEKHFVAEKRFRCPVCLADFTLKRSTLRHLKSVHHKSAEQVEKLKSRIHVHFVRIKSSQKQEEDKSNQDQNKDTSCRRNSNRSSESSADNSPKKTLALVPVVTLTPIATGSYLPKVETDDGETPSPAQPKKSSSKKVALPLASCSTNSKKIGIQVRMNYCKDTTSAPNSANVTPTSYATSSITSQSSGDSSRRNSILSVIGCDDVPPKADSFGKNSHNTRSGSKLANILENLYDKRSKTDRTETRPDKVTIYCNSCRKLYLVNEFNCDASSEDVRRYFKCALRDCNFRSEDIDQLMPHLSAHHSILNENELANVKSIFLADFSDRNGLDCLGDCKRRPAFYERNEESKVKKKVEKHTNDPSESTSNKRKLPLNTNKSTSGKRKTPQNDTESKINIDNIEDIQIKGEDTAHPDHETGPTKRTKKITKKDEQPVRPKTIQIEHTTLLNGDVESSSSGEDDASEKPEMVPKLKPNHGKSIRQQKIAAFDQKLWKSPQRMNLNIFHSELSPSSSAPDSDHDQSVMSDENLRKSIMTIIFGKDMTAEKVEENMSTREKSPSSSSSSECGKEKRYSFRIAKQGSQKNSTPVDSKDDKTLKQSCLSKSKPTTSR